MEEPTLVVRADSATDSSPLARAPETGSPLSGEWNNMAPSTRAVGSLYLAAQREPTGLPERVLNTISEARAPSTRRLYTLKWSVFSTWCLNRGENPSTSELAVVLSFLQELLDKGRSHSTLKVFVAAIAAFHAPIAGQSVGRDNSVDFERSAPFRRTEQLFVGFGNCAKGHPVTKQRLSKWIVDAVMLAYSSLGLQCPIGVRAHSTRGIASSWAWSSGVSITEICAAAGWATPSTFARFYNLDIPALQARVLSA